jgi:zinc/manganese transport system ATP-binding protein
MDRPVTNPHLIFDNLTLGYDRHPAVHHLSGVVTEGDLLAVAGPNGAGKSTLLKAIAGVLPVMDGKISFQSGSDPRIGYLPQNAEIDRNFPLPVFDFVAAGLWSGFRLFRSIGKAERAKIERALADVGLAGFGDRQLRTLSGGQVQRCLFARLILQDARLILLDEPFRAVDAATITDLLALIHGWQAEGRTVIAVIHDLDMIRAHFPRTLLLARDPLDWGQTADVLTEANLARARALVGAPDPFAAACVRAA